LRTSNGCSIKELHSCELGSREYWFRTPTAYDTPRLRRELTLQGIRRPLPIEFRVAAIAGIEALGDTAGEPEETERQKELIEEWYELLAPIGEDDIDEPDLDEARRRARSAPRRAGERARARIFPQVAAIEANLARHWQPYRELLADRGYWDDASRHRHRAAAACARGQRGAGARRGRHGDPRGIPRHPAERPRAAGDVRVWPPLPDGDAKKKLIIAAAYAFDAEAFAGGEEYTPAQPLRGDSFVGQQPAGVRWLHVHPDYLVTDASWAIVRLAGAWRDGVLPEPGGVLDQAAWTIAAIGVVSAAWGKLEDDRFKKLKGN
jgi:hypothetical protein